MKFAGMRPSSNSYQVLKSTVKKEVLIGTFETVNDSMLNTCNSPSQNTCNSLNSRSRDHFCKTLRCIGSQVSNFANDNRRDSFSNKLFVNLLLLLLLIVLGCSNFNIGTSGSVKLKEMTFLIQ